MEREVYVEKQENKQSGGSLVVGGVQPSHVSNEGHFPPQHENYLMKSSLFIYSVV